MAVPILTENSILVYDFASSRSEIPFENKAGAHFFNALAFPAAHSGNFREDECKIWNRRVDTNQSEHSGVNDDVEIKK